MCFAMKLVIESEKNSFIYGKRMDEYSWSLTDSPSYAHSVFVLSRKVMTQCLCCPGEYDSVFVLSRRVMTQCLCCPGES